MSCTNYVLQIDVADNLCFFVYCHQTFVQAFACTSCYLLGPLLIRSLAARLNARSVELASGDVCFSSVSVLDVGAGVEQGLRPFLGSIQAGDILVLDIHTHIYTHSLSLSLRPNLRLGVVLGFNHALFII